MSTSGFFTTNTYKNGKINEPRGGIGVGESFRTFALGERLWITKILVTNNDI